MKYNNIKKEIDGILFDSTMEANYYLYLLKEKAEGRIIEIRLQPIFLLMPAFRKFSQLIRKIEYKADFLVTYADGTRLVIDVKGMLTDTFKLKAKLFDYYHSDLELKLITLHNGKWINAKDKPKRKKTKRQE